MRHDDQQQPEWQHAVVEDPEQVVCLKLHVILPKEPSTEMSEEGSRQVIAR
jgi:hypothetical protein